jgi:hypothetical protein
MDRQADACWWNYVGEGAGGHAAWAVPKGTKGTVSVPVTSEKVMVAVNSKLVYVVGRRAFNPKYKDGHVTVQLEDGKHVITASK